MIEDIHFLVLDQGEEVAVRERRNPGALGRIRTVSITVMGSIMIERLDGSSDKRWLSVIAP